MTTEFQAIIEHIVKERGIDRETLIKAIEVALQTSAKKADKRVKFSRIEINRDTYQIRAFTTARVVERARIGSTEEISLEEARKINPEVNIGDTVEIEVKPKNLGRMAAQTARQVILQKIKQAERDMVFEEFKDRIGEIVSGTICRLEHNNIIVDIGRTEAILPESERIPTEEYQIGDRIRGCIMKVEKQPSGTTIVISRTSPEFVKALFRLEVSEIADGIVEIKGIAREAGYRTKIAVVSHDERIDPVGACVGIRGSRVKNIVRELNGEKIDIIKWSDDIRTYVSNALAPARLTEVTLDPKIPRLVHVVTEPDQLSLAIGKKGQNVRLTAKLVGLRIDIRKDEGKLSFEEKVASAINQLAAVPGIGRERAEALVKAGFLTVEGILVAEIKDIQEMTGFDEETAKQIYAAAESAHSLNTEDTPEESHESP
jgi:N utilization substance protein A